MLLILRHLYLPSIRKKKIPTETENQTMQRKMKIATALAMIDTKRCFVENLQNSTRAFKYDISQSQSYFNMLVGCAGVLTAGGISLRTPKKMLDYSIKQMAGKNTGVLLYCFRCIEMMYNFQAGIGQCEIDETSINEAFKIGDFPFATGQLLYSVYIRIELGDFARCETIIKKLHQIYEEYNFEHAESDVYVLKTKLSMKRRKIYEARNYADQSIIQSNKTKWHGRVVESFGIKTRVEVLCGNLDAARETIEKAEELIRQIGKEAVFITWYCDHLMGMFLYNLAMMENAILINKPGDIKKFKKAALRSGKDTLSYTQKKVASEKTESFRLMGRYYWLINKQEKALAWWDKAIKEGEKLRARPELSRTYFEIGKALLDSKCKYEEWNSMSAKNYLNKARTMFEEMDLHWDLDELEKVAASD